MLYSRADESTLKRCRYIRFHKHPLVVILCSGSHHVFRGRGVRATQQRGGWPSAQHHDDMGPMRHKSVTRVCVLLCARGVDCDVVCWGEWSCGRCRRTRMHTGQRSGMRRWMTGSWTSGPRSSTLEWCGGCSNGARCAGWQQWTATSGSTTSGGGRRWPFRWRKHARIGGK